MAGNEIYDRLAKVLKDVHERFPGDAFAKHQRLRGMLADHLQGADREIRITLDVIDEGVVKVLTETPAAERGMQIDRLVTRLDTSRGIREDIARQIIQAFAYALNLGGLPSTIVSQRGPVPVTPSQPGQDWVGLSETVQPAPPPPPVVDHGGPKPQSLSEKLSKNKNGVMLASAALVIGALYFSNQGQNPAVEGPPVGGDGVPVEVGTVPGAGGNPPQGQEGQPAQGRGGMPPQGQGGVQQPGPQQGPGPQGGGTPQPPRGQQGGAAPAQPLQQGGGQTQPIQQGGGGAQPQQPPAQQPGQPQTQGVTAQSLWYDPYGQIWQMQYSGNQFQGTTNAGGNVAGLMGQFNPQDNTIQYQVFNGSGQAVWQGQGQFADQTHISFVTTDMNGNVVGQGQFHIDHPPSQ